MGRLLQGLAVSEVSIDGPPVGTHPGVPSTEGTSCAGRPKEVCPVGDWTVDSWGLGSGGCRPCEDNEHVQGGLCD